MQKHSLLQIKIHGAFVTRIKRDVTYKRSKC